MMIDEGEKLLNIIAIFAALGGATAGEWQLEGLATYAMGNDDMHDDCGIDENVRPISLSFFCTIYLLAFFYHDIISLTHPLPLSSSTD